MTYHRTSKRVTDFFLIAIILIILPLLGILFNNETITNYLEFPPKTRYVRHATFSWIAFIMMGSFVLAVIAPFIIRGFKKIDPIKQMKKASFPFPWWGWLGIGLGILSWIMAWNRIPWFSVFQRHTFTPLWISYILTVNALSYKRTGFCTMTARPGYFISLFFLSAAFWWFFEYLNRFVQNWYYVETTFSPFEYFLFATLPFSTVLPAVTGTREWLLTFSWPENRFNNFKPVYIEHPKAVAWLVLLIAGIGLLLLGLYPNFLYPLLWVSPLIVISSIETIRGEKTIFSDITKGNYSLIVCSALAALMCGFFWEMWNINSLAKWKYSVPYVDRFHIFEMPLLGFAGYLPFGLECTVIADFFTKKKVPD